jgi:hypothetical protein
MVDIVDLHQEEELSSSSMNKIAGGQDKRPSAKGALAAPNAAPMEGNNAILIALAGALFIGLIAWG